MMSFNSWVTNKPHINNFALNGLGKHLLQPCYFFFFISYYFLLAIPLSIAQPLAFEDQIFGKSNFVFLLPAYSNKVDPFSHDFQFTDQLHQPQPFFYQIAPALDKSTLTIQKKYQPDIFPSYHVIIKAPKKLSKLLKDNLGIVRHSKNNQIISHKQFDYLIATTEKHAKELLKTEGYFSSKIVINERRNKNFNALKKESDYPISKIINKRTVIVDVNPGEQAKVNRVILTFDGEVNDEALERIDAIRNIFSLRKGDLFSQEIWENAKTNALVELQSERYLGAYISFSEAFVRKERGEVDLRIDFVSGPTFYLGPVTFSGMHRYPEFIVRYINPLRVGEIYSRARINELQRKIQNTSYYSGVGLDVSNLTAFTPYVPVKANLREFPFYSVRTGLGYSTDRGPHLQGSFSFNNLFGRSWIFTTQGRYEKKNRFGSVAFIMPPDQRGYTNSLTAAYNTTYLSHSPMTSMRLGLSRERSFQFDDYAYSLLLYWNSVKQQSMSPQSSFAVMPNFKWVKRDINDLIYPSDGYFFNFEVGLAVKAFFSKANFVRLHSQGRRYFAPSEKSIVILRSELGAILSSSSANDIPSSLRFRTGGALSVRGYPFEGIGNRLLSGVFSTKYMFNMSGEYQYWFLKSWGGAFFFDMGLAINNLEKARYYPGYGLGIRWHSPVGPVNIDLGFGLFSGVPRLHFALGIAL